MPGPGGGGASSKGVIDALTNTYTDVAKMMLLPDAGQHMKFLQGLQQGIMSYIQMAARASLGPMPGGGLAGQGGMGGGMGAGASGGGPPPPPGPGGGAPPGPPAGGPPPGLGPQRIAPGGGAGMGGLMTQPNPDELRQLLGAGGQ